MINRSAVVVRPRQPYIDWAAGLDDSGMVPSDEDDRTVNLLPSDEDDIDGTATIARAWELIFEAELEHWHLIMEDWPTDRTLAMFYERFEVEIHTMIQDLCADPLVDDG